MKNKLVTAIILHNDQTDWFVRNATKFVNGIVSRMNGGEIDKYPGAARWDGDGIPGAQVVWVGNSNVNGIISVGQGHGVRLGVAHCKNTHANKLDMLKELAEEMGYSLRKKPTRKKSANSKAKK